MPPTMKRLLADLQLPAYCFDRRALVEVPSASRSFAMISCALCRFFFIESSRPLGPLDSHK